ncbi:MAG: hypothetical protein KDK90_14575 [Leptospiraceae bacterium]|nr:hypothetical protein [Leptospiraceae bacterium]
MTNTTFTLVSTHKPMVLFKKFQPMEVKKGLYRISGMSIIDVNLVINEELEQSFEKDYRILKTFTGKKDRESVILKALESETDESLEDLFILYGEEIGKILEMLGKDMTAVQERVLELADKFGIKEKISQEAFEKGLEKGLRREHKRTAIRLRKSGMSTL